MRFQVSQKLLALGGDFSVRDEAGREAFYFDGKLFSLGGKRVVVLDPKRKEVARIVQKPLSFTPTYRVKRNGVVAATIKKRRFSLRDTFLIDVPGTNDFQVVGGYIGFEYTIRRGAIEVARISKRFFSSNDSYGVEVHHGDPVLLLCAVIVIDLVLFKRRRS